ncbi:Hypothetical protein Cul210932_2339 [Corynebacterium ulcerans]|nr:Hypothetical protein Cul210932_2339 [Corynebacterium ulcerans]ALD96040.1 Hypothetical protein Cul131001_2375 [Corynebacterium ulcerans]SQG56728.1 Uncharacterised protein [Corynebacterium ulcerans]
MVAAVFVIPPGDYVLDVFIFPFGAAMLGQRDSVVKVPELFVLPVEVLRMVPRET